MLDDQGSRAWRRHFIRMADISSAARDHDIQYSAGYPVRADPPHTGLATLSRPPTHQRRCSAPCSPGDIASIYASLGDNENALVWLDRALQQRASMRGFLAQNPHLRRAARRSPFCGNRRSGGSLETATDEEMTGTPRSENPRPRLGGRHGLLRPCSSLSPSLAARWSRPVHD
jgi:hypothetical protein